MIVRQAAARSDQKISRQLLRLRACVNAKSGQFRLTLFNDLVNLLINISVFNDK